MGSETEVLYVKLGKKSLEATQPNALVDNLANLDYGKHVSLKAQITYLNLLTEIEEDHRLEGLHQKDHLLEGFNKMFGIMFSNTPITSSPRDSVDREQFYKKLSNGYQFMGELIGEELHKGSLAKPEVYACLDAIGDGGHACAGRWQQVLDELSIGFSDKINEKLGLPPIHQDRFDREIQNLFYQSKTVAANKLSEAFVNETLSDISSGNKLHYTAFFKRFLNKNLNLNLPINMEEDSFLESHLISLNHSAVAFYRKRGFTSQTLETFTDLFQDKIMKDEFFYNTYMDYSKRFFDHCPYKEKYEDVVEFLSKEIFDGFSKKVKEPALNHFLCSKGYLDKFNKLIEIEPFVDLLLKNLQYKKLKSFLFGLSNETLEKDDVKELLNKKNEQGHTLLIYAIQESTPSFACFLLEKGANPNLKSENGTPPLLYATSSEKNDVAKMILQKGGDVNGRNFYENTALIFASDQGNLHLANHLIEKKADVNLVNFEGNSALMYATIKGHLEIVKFLIAHHANVDIQNKRGESALMMASEVGNQEMVKILLDHGASIHISDRTHNTPLSLAEKGNHTFVVQLLKEKQKTLTAEKNQISSSENPKKRSEDFQDLRMTRSMKKRTFSNIDFH
jgi:ankyrin repeat protein